MSSRPALGRRQCTSVWSGAHGTGAVSWQLQVRRTGGESLVVTTFACSDRPRKRAQKQ